MKEFINVNTEYFRGYMAGYTAATVNLEDDSKSGDGFGSDSVFEKVLEELAGILRDRYNLSFCKAASVINDIKAAKTGYSASYDFQYLTFYEHCIVECNGKQFTGDCSEVSLGGVTSAATLYTNDFNKLCSDTSSFLIVSNPSSYLEMCFFDSDVNYLGDLRYGLPRTAGVSGCSGSWN
jgi:hypothetical protein